MAEQFDATQAVAAAASAGAPGHPKKVAVVHYGPEGGRVATTGTASYGTSGGSTVSYDSAIAGGKPYSSSTVAVDSAGRATSASTALLAPDGSVRRHLSTDYSGLTYNAVGLPVSGSVKLAVHDAEQVKLHDAEMVFADERYQAYHVTSYAPSDGTTVTGTAHFDYAGVSLVGNKVVGGQLAATYLAADGTPTMSTVSLLNTAGVPTTVHSTNFAPDGTTPRGLVVSDYRGVAFDPRRQIGTGKLLITTLTPGGDPKSASMFSYDHGRLIGRAPYVERTYIPEFVAVPVDVTGPPAPTRPPDTTSEVHRPDGTLLEVRQTWHTPGSDAAHPTPRRSITSTYALDGHTAVRAADIDYAGATFDPTGAPDGGTVVSTSYVGGVRVSVSNIQY